MLLFGAWGGLIADRRRQAAPPLTTQTSAGCLALALGLLVLIGHGPAGSAHLWEVYVLALLLGLVNMFDNPARQTFVIEMVGKDDLHQRRELEQHRHERGPGHRARHRGHPDRHGRARGVLPRQLGELRGGHRGC
jgi:hypothetical protein